MRTIKLGRFPGDPEEFDYLSPKILRLAKKTFREMANENDNPIIFRFGDVRESAVLESLSLVETVIESDIEAISETENFLGSGGPIVYFVGKKRRATPKAVFSFHSFIYKVKSSWILDPIQEALVKRRMKRHNYRFAQILRHRTNMSEYEIDNIVLRVKGRLVYKAAHAHAVHIVTDIVDSLD